LEASLQLELYDEELDSEPYQVGIHTLAPLEPVAEGPKAMIERVRRAVGEIAKAGKFPLVLGGDHSITLGAVQALSSHYGKLSVLQLDAHADLRDEYQGTRWSHACVGRRIGELARLTQIGLRSLSREEAEFLKSSDITAIYAHELSQGAVERVIDDLGDPVYLTLDMDVFDPALVPAVGTPEPGGLGWPVVLAILKRVFKTHRVVGCDIVELAPIPGLIAPDFLAAKLVYKLIGYWGKFQNRG